MGNNQQHEITNATKPCKRLFKVDLMPLVLGYFGHAEEGLMFMSQFTKDTNELVKRREDRTIIINQLYMSGATRSRFPKKPLCNDFYEQTYLRYIMETGNLVRFEVFA
jgi:hypothetical protein